jgi:hypothetical protein
MEEMDLWRRLDLVARIPVTTNVGCLAGFV